MRIWTRKTKKRTPKTRTRTATIGSSWTLSVSLIFLWGVFSNPVLSAAKKEKSKNGVAPYALIAGTVYRPPGFALPGVEVVVSPEQPEVNGTKLKKAQAVTDVRGEWAIRVPPVPAKWQVNVKIDGYRPEQRSVSVEGEQRVDLSITLEPAHPTKEVR
jgi:hypothetical protein